MDATVLNRDINACLNMAIIFLSIVSGSGRPRRFCRTNDRLAMDAAVLRQGGTADDDFQEI